MLKYFFSLSLCLLLSPCLRSQDMSIASLGLKIPVLHNCTAVKDQYNSSTCWSFSSMSLLESEELKMGRGNTDLSEMYIARYSYIRKIETHLKLQGKNFFTPGGQFHDVVWVMKHYGIVPESEYSGRTRGQINHDHQELDTAIVHFVNKLLLQKITSLTAEHRRIIDSIFDHHLGKVPTRFNYNGAEYTPMSFMKKYLAINPDDYIEITSYTHHPFYTRFVLEDKYNWTGDSYYNVPVNDLLTITNTALQKGYTVSWDGDVTESTFYFARNLAYLPGPISNLQAERQRTFEDGTTAIDHMMHIIAVTKDNKGSDWYLIKNSWGTVSNELKGYLFMSRDYLAIKTGAIIVNKKAISPGIRKKLNLN